MLTVSLMVSYKLGMAKAITDLVAAMRENPAGTRFADALKVAEHYFGKARQSTGSHVVFRMPWAGDPRVNLQRDKGGKAKAYQVRQLVGAIERHEMLKTQGEGSCDG